LKPALPVLPCLLTVPLLFALDPPNAKIDEIFQDFNKPDRAGVSLAVVHQGRIVYQKGYGSANLEYAVPVGPETVFHVASVSKQFTAMALVLLEQDQRLSLEDEVRKHLPELPDYGPKLAIRDLLQHTAGIRDQWQTLALAGWRLDDVITQQQILRMLFHQRELNFTPRTEHLYSNGGYTLAAEIVKRVSGKSLDEFAKERIFDPLGMAHTHFHEDHQRIVRNRAYSYFMRMNAPVAAPLNYANVGATSLFSTAPDLVRWLDNFRTGKAGGAAAIARLQERAVLSNGEAVTYALGVAISEHRGLKTVSHSGGDAGYRSYVVWFPDQTLGIAVLSNSGNAAPAQLAHRVAALYAGSAMQPESAKTALAKPPESAFIELDPAAHKPLLGIYRTPAVVLAVESENGKLTLAPLGQQRIELRPLSPTRYFAGLPINAEVEFKPESQPRRIHLLLSEMTLSGEALNTQPYRPSDLPGYAGVYWSDELETQYTLEVRGSDLIASHPRHLEIRLRPAAKDYFAGNTWFFGEVRFTRDPQGSISGMTVGGGRVRGIKFVRRRS
jgi:CubicO group peptidase (beta-lactamase class C family)